MADLTWTPLTYLNGGKDAPLRTKARLRSRLSRYRERDDAHARVLNAFFFFFFGRLVLRAAPATARFRINFPQNVTLLGPKS